MQNRRNRDNESYNNNQFQYDRHQHRFLNRFDDDDSLPHNRRSLVRSNRMGFEEDSLGYQNRGYHYSPSAAELLGNPPFKNLESYSSHQARLDHHNEGPIFENAKNAVKSFFGKGPKGYQRSDERIKEDICEALYHHHEIDASDIEVAVKSGVVTLTGSVDSKENKWLLEDVVINCSGVKDVSNLVRVQNERRLSSNEIARSTISPD